MHNLPPLLSSIMESNNMLSGWPILIANPKPKRRYPFQSTCKDYSKHSFLSVKVNPRRDGDFMGKGWKKAPWNQGESNALA